MIVVTNNSTEAEVKPQEAVVKAKAIVEEKSASTQEVEKDEIIDESETSEKLEASSDDSQEKEDSEESKDEFEQKGVKKKIDKLTKRVTEAKREADFWKQEALKVKAQETKEVEAKKPETVQAEGKPNPDNFESHAEYIEAVTDWKLDQRDKAKEEKSKADSAKDEYQNSVKAHQERINKFKAENKDYDEVIADFVEDHGDVTFSLTVEESILSSDLGPALIYELAKNPEEFKRINSLGPIAAARELGRIEQRLSKASESSEEKANETEKKQTKAPAPMKTIGSKSSGSVKKSIFEAGSQAEYEAIRREQMKRSS